MEKNPIEIGTLKTSDPEKEKQFRSEAEKIHSAVVQWFADTGEYFLEDIPISKENIIELIPDIYKDYEINETIPSDD